jgi:hypothetical protein
MLVIYLIFPFQKSKRVACLVEGCKGLVVNINRHMRLKCHPETLPAAGQPKRVYDRKECAVCGLVTRRLDLHLQRMHGMQKGEDLQAALKSSRVRRNV